MQSLLWVVVLGRRYMLCGLNLSLFSSGQGLGCLMSHMPTPEGYRTAAFEPEKPHTAL